MTSSTEVYSAQHKGFQDGRQSAFKQIHRGACACTRWPRCHPHGFAGEMRLSNVHICADHEHLEPEAAPEPVDAMPAGPPSNPRDRIVQAVDDLFERYAAVVDELDRLKNPGPGSVGCSLILLERHRQISEEGYTEEHDIGASENLARAAAAYAIPEWIRRHWPKYAPGGAGNPDIPGVWPWPDADWKPTSDDRLGELVKAGALVAAAIDSILAAEAREYARRGRQ